MNNIKDLNGIATFGGKWSIALLVSLLLAVSACETDSQGDAADEEAPPNEAKAQIADVTDSEENPGRLYCLELTSARDRVLLGEPLTLIVALRNCSDETLSVRDLLSPEYGILGLRIGHPQYQQQQSYYPPVRRDGRGKGYVELAAGEILAATIPVYFGRDGWQLDAPGTYTFQADYSVDETSLMSNIVAVSIDSPEHEADLKAAQTMMNASAATYFFLGGGDEKGAAELRALVTEFPDSPWAGYARLGLAIDSANDSHSSSRMESCRLLESLLLEPGQDWIIALRAYDTLSNCLQEKGLESEIPGITAEFVSRHPYAEATLRARGN